MNQYLTQPKSSKRLMGSIFRDSSSTYKDLKINDIIHECKKLRIGVQKLQFTQLEEGIGIKSYKAFRYQNSKAQAIQLFICQAGQTRQASTYFMGSQLQSIIVKTQRDVVMLLQNSLKILELSSEKYLSKHYQNLKNQDKINHLLTKLAEQCNKIEKSSSKYEAVQIIKSTDEYSNVIQYMKNLCYDLQQLCKENRKEAQIIQKDNAYIQQSLMTLQSVKEELETAVIQYQSTRQQYMDIPQIMDQIIQKKKQNIQSKDFYDEASLQRYIQQLTELKVLENQKKYLV